MEIAESNSIDMIRVLQIASFNGNIGDNANHLGFRQWFCRQFDDELSWTELEIRRFFWKFQSWDQSFVNYANEYDLIVIGGGNYFELWVEKSPTGTSIEISEDLFDQISTPIFFNALGVDPGQGVSTSCRNKFRKFITKIANSQKHFVTVRNDGALKNIREYIGHEFLEGVYGLPDHGFFFSEFVTQQKIYTQPNNVKNIVINVATDMSEIRFRKFDGSSGFLSEFSETIVSVSKLFPSIEFVLVPHIFRDIEAIGELLNYLPDWLRRTRIKVAELGSGNAAAQKSFEKYFNASLVIAMRFHANVCPIGFGVRTIGLATYPQIENVFEEIDLPEYVLDVSNPGFKVDLFNKIKSVLGKDQNEIDEMYKDVKVNLLKKRNHVEISMKNWRSENCLGN